MTCQVWCDVFSLSHDPEYWEDPWTFNPERFLDEQGQLVGVDYPNRRRWVLQLLLEICSQVSLFCVEVHFKYEKSIFGENWFCSFRLLNFGAGRRACVGEVRVLKF